MYCVAVDVGPVLSVNGLALPDASGVVSPVGAVAVPHQNI